MFAKPCYKVAVTQSYILGVSMYANHTFCAFRLIGIYQHTHMDTKKAVPTDKFGGICCFRSHTFALGFPKILINEAH